MLRKNKTELAAREAQPVDPFREFDRVFDSFRTGLEDMFLSPLGFRLWGDATVRAPAVDLVDKGGEFVVTAELPGVAKENLDIEVSEDGAEIRARTETERKEEDKGYYLHERTQDSWYRRVPFPAEVVADRAEAELKDGVLTLRVPKLQTTPETKARKVTVK